MEIVWADGAAFVKRGLGSGIKIDSDRINPK